MKMTKKLLGLLFVVGLTASMVSCSDDEEPKAEKDGIISSQSDPDLVVGDLQGDITGDITLAADKQWVLNGSLVVKDGASLIIEAGTTIKATAGGTSVYVAVERGAKIEAIGTTESPIKFTSNSASPAQGDWGGILLMGYAPITGFSASNTPSAVTEVVDFIYGGDDEEDNSGTLKYVIIEYTGARINGEKEFNGLTLYGVGNGTVIENIALYYGDDDAIEWFGGSVDVTNLLVVNATDDMFDYTQGWNGTLTNAFGIREAGYDEVSADPRGIEGDGNLDGLTPTLSRQSNPTFTNITVQNNSTVANSGNSGLVDVFKIRRNSSGTFTNMLFIQGDGVPVPADFVDCTDSAGDAAATASINASAQGANAATVKTDLKPGANNATITVPGTDNTGANTSAFAWTGYFN